MRTVIDWIRHLQTAGQRAVQSCKYVRCVVVGTSADEGGEKSSLGRSDVTDFEERIDALEIYFWKKKKERLRSEEMVSSEAGGDDGEREREREREREEADRGIAASSMDDE
ncbi:uncharacterized protein VDAG_09590 [Verticillium dahliae VdLs.17]|uniref:Uncharacterized protein n=1 Tax=Verticillium dahliae (strain VdLs.17 / ATCC MYA-4575 / FGSC 10137) TaxID=498257 RepID=G2XHU0_VERDV|nr:uncharacterized protein VDAG_09590 [Verticillium dahliae VdLs.17]EGY19388.1 hypothetical protein VDAG_09590 [Verticillium dahliae VdLs.17]